MSAQTGTPSFVSPPPSSHAIVRARASFEKAKSEPNPIWIRELKQAARLKRTPIVLMAATVLIALLMCALGGLLSANTSPASIGVALFHTFFSAAFFVVVLVGPALAANSVASEREGRTWEAVILTGIQPKTIARGKFLSALTSILLYVVMLAPVGALPFLFGGVTATEVVVAFAFLFLFAVLSVAFGLAISSVMTSGRTAILLTLLLAFPLSLLAYFVCGVALSYAAHAVWPAVIGGPPVWLPTAYERAPFSVEYVTFLVLIPIAVVVLPAWYLYEVTTANLMGITDDRATGLKRWFAIMSPLLLAAAAVPSTTVPTATPSVGFVLSMSAVCLFMTFCVFLFQGDALGPSRRVLVHWHRNNASWIVRFFGPGLMNTMLLVLVFGLASLVALAVLGVLVAELSPLVVRSRWLEVEKIASFFAYSATYFLFLVGFGAWIRTKSTSVATARVLLAVAIFFTAVAPWLFAVIIGAVADGSGSDAIAVAAPSPFFVFFLQAALDDSHRQMALSAGALSSAAWALIGLGLIAAASVRSKAIVATHHRMLADAEALFAREDAEALENPDSAPEPEAEGDPA